MKVNYLFLSLPQQGRLGGVGGLPGRDSAVSRYNFVSLSSSSRRFPVFVALVNAFWIKSNKESKNQHNPEEANGKRK